MEAEHPRNPVPVATPTAVLLQPVVGALLVRIAASSQAQHDGNQYGSAH